MKNKVIVITGASQGLGRELSLKLAKMGARIALVSRQQKLLETVKQTIIADGGESEIFVADVTNLDQIKDTIQKIIEKFGQIDVLINNAGIWTTDKFEDKDSSQTVKAFMVNSVGPIFCSRAILPTFIKQGFGHILFINSIAGLDIAENSDFPTYTATKWAVTGYGKALARKFDGTNIKITSIHPGPFESDILKNSGDDWGPDHSFMMKTAEIADAVVYALNAPGKIQIGTMELKNTNWNS
jgi:NADP-dependent 3-hydroxy acid dehydrogenase YdfG